MNDALLLNPLRILLGTLCVRMWFIVLPLQSKDNVFQKLVFFQIKRKNPTIMECRSFSNSWKWQFLVSTKSAGIACLV